MKGDAVQLRVHVAAGHHSICPLHAGSDVAAQILVVAVVPSPVVAYVVVVVAESLSAVRAVATVAFVESVVVVSDEVPVAAATADASAVPAAVFRGASAFVSASAVAPATAESDVGYLPVHYNSNLAKSNCNRLPSSA